MAEATQPLVVGSRTVAHGTVWNLVGRISPVIAAIIATPYLIANLGETRWGVLTIALSVIGVFGIFDLGIGRALTREIAERLGAGEQKQAASLVLAGLLVLTGLGLLGGIVSASVAPLWVRRGLNIPPELQGEVLESVYLLCASAPLVVLNAAMWGVIAACQKFRIANIINVPIMVLYYVGPLIALQLWDSMVGVMLTLIACRLAMTIGYAIVCLREMPALRTSRVALAELRPLLRLGGWMTLSGLIFPMLMYADRFVMASTLSAGETGYYTTPFDLVVRFTIISIAVTNSLFPAMAGSYRVDPSNTTTLFRHSALAVAVMLFPACQLVVGLSLPLLTLWLGLSFAQHSAVVLAWLGVGIFLNCIDSIVASFIDGVGRPDINAKFSMMELALYLPLLVALLTVFGIEGAAVAWTLRNAADLTIRLWLARRLYPAIGPTIALLAPTLLAGTVLLALPLLANGTMWRLAIMLIAMCLFLWVIWARALTTVDRTVIRSYLQRTPVVGRNILATYWRSIAGTTP